MESRPSSRAKEGADIPTQSQQSGLEAPRGMASRHLRWHETMLCPSLAYVAFGQYHETENLPAHIGNSFFIEQPMRLLACVIEPSAMLAFGPSTGSGNKIWVDNIYLMSLHLLHA